VTERQFRRPQAERLTSVDADTGQSNTFLAGSGSGANSHGTYTVTAGGCGPTRSTARTAPCRRWAPRHADHTFVVTSGDGSATQTVTVTINGTNDIPTIGGTFVGSVTEDNLAVAIGTLTSTDTGHGREQHVYGGRWGRCQCYGTYAVDAAGHWTYTLNSGVPACRRWERPAR